MVTIPFIKNVEFVANIITTWHYEVVISYLKSDECRYKNGSIFIIPQSNIQNKSAKRLNDETLINIDNINIKYINIEGFDYLASTNFSRKELFSLVLKNIFVRDKKAIDVFNPGKINIRSIFNLLKYGYNRINYILYDEGTASYLSDTNHHFIVNKFTDNNKKSDFIRKLKTTFKYFIKNTTINLLRFLGILNIKEYMLFQKKAGKLVPNNNVVENLKNIYNTGNIDTTEKTGGVLILKDFDEKMIPKKQIIPFFIEIINRLGLENETIYIKKHPNDLDTGFDKEIIRKFPNIEIIHDKIGAEMLAVKYKPRLLIGGISTSAFTLPIIFGIKSYNFILIYKKYSLDRDYLYRINKFHSYFKGQQKLIEFIE
ncbi:MAG: polysialyltransferase family glycosyltransferase [Bacillota bacterium]